MQSIKPFLDSSESVLRSTAACLIALCFFTSAEAAPIYVVRDLGTLSGTFSAAASINNLGQVVGFSSITGDVELHASLFNSSNNTTTDLGTLGGIYSNAFAINNTGQIVGHSNLLGDMSSHATLFSSAGPADLGTLGGLNSEAFGINDSGVVVGGPTPLVTHIMLRCLTPRVAPTLI